MSQQPTAKSDNEALQFLQLCLQGRFDPDVLEVARQSAIADRIDWDIVKDLVNRERLAPLLYSIVRDTDILPGLYEDELSSVYIRYGFHNARLLQSVELVVKNFNGAGVGIIVLKGAALAETVYDNIAVRPMVDVHVLVRRVDVDRALAILTDMGYQIENSGFLGISADMRVKSCSKFFRLFNKR